MLTRKLKKLLLLTAALLLSFSAGGCNDPSSPVPEPVPVEEKIPSPPSFVEQLVGRYRYNSEENGDILLELYHINGMLIAEADEEYAAYVAASATPRPTATPKRSTGKTLYILDEPTTGLHSYDVDKLIKILSRLRDGGNTVLVIEHNLDVIKTADYIIDLGPEGGNGGGTLVCQGSPEEVAKHDTSYTGFFLKKVLKQ